ncbi:MAG: PIN domain-containing protein [Verrucomicrobia bacterium]|nr:PIN domain-containing protein [Pseudomonadota bacterium]NBS05890.1 PIN domain-containing protein [Verrucomicrobiota bacterium]NBS78478.1 PIN domain-containing protein [bacterium]NBT23315.1 PIN domain-containing protein [bacterium]NBV96169.1 PIN domain-containing protein [Verrucomicrobiota bacterium]
MRLIDTSCWVHQLRKNGNAEIRQKVESLLRAGKAGWCAPVRLELWAGVGRDPEADVLRYYASVLPDFPVEPEVWNLADTLAIRGRRRGKSAPSMDILIAACARHHRVEVEADDEHFNWLMTV